LFASQHWVVRIGGPFANDPQAQWTVFGDPRTGRRAIVLANLGRRPLRARQVALANPRHRSCRVFQPFRPTRIARLPLDLTIPAERVAVVAEEPGLAD